MTSRPTRRLPLRQRIQDVIAPYEEGTRYPRLSLTVDLFILGCIVISCVLVPLEHYLPQHAGLLTRIELAFTAIFVVEYLLRWYAAPNRLLYPLTFYAVIDLLAILPTLLMLGVEMILLRSLRGIRLLRMLRLLRLLRLLKFLRHGYLIHRALIELRVWLSALNHTYHLYRLGRLCVWLVLAWFVGTNIVYLTESSLSGEGGPFGDYWKSYWHVIIVLISGIEDKEPISLLGRAEVTVLMFAGICVVGMLTGEIVSILVKRMQRAGKVAVLPPGSQIAEHVLILGANSHLDHVIEQIHAALGGQHFIVLVHPDATERQVTDPRLFRKVFALSGNPVELRVLQEAGIERALRAIVLSPEPSQDGDPRDSEPCRLDGQALMETLAVVSGRREIPLVVQLQSEESLHCVEQLQGAEIVMARQYEEKLIAQAVINPGLTAIYDELMTFGEDSTEFYSVAVPPELVGKPFSAAQIYCLDRAGEPVVAVGIDRSPAERPHTSYWLNPAEVLTESELVLRSADRLVVLADTRPTFVEIDKEEMWSGRVIPRS